MRSTSFIAGTPVETEAGQKPIEEIQVGDKVLAEDPETGEQGYFEVVALTNHPTDEVLQATVEAEATLKGAGAQAEAEKETSTLDTNTESGDNDQAQLNSGADDDHRPTFQPSNLPTLHLTPDHPVYVEGKGWLWAENLTVGDRLRRADGGMAKVLTVERVKLAKPEVVYNFTVKGPHTYFVLEVGVLVHNAEVCSLYEDYVEYRLPNTHPFSGPQKRFVKDVPGLYEKIPVIDELPEGFHENLRISGLPSDWQVTDAIVSNGVVYYNVRHNNGAVGIFTRFYNKSERRITMKQAFLWDFKASNPPKLPRWINAGVSYPGRNGLPTATFFTLQQMRQMGIGFGSLKKVKFDGIINLETRLHLRWLEDNYGGELVDLVGDTHTIRYAEGALTQSGHRIVPGSFEVFNADSYTTLGQIRKSYTLDSGELTPYFRKLQEDYGFTDAPDELKIINSFDIEAKLQPIVK